MYREAGRKIETIQKPLLEEIPRGVDVLRTGIEHYMIISKLPYLQAVLQAVKSDFVKYVIIVHLAFQKAVLREIEYS